MLSPGDPDRSLAGEGIGTRPPPQFLDKLRQRRQPAADHENIGIEHIDEAGGEPCEAVGQALESGLGGTLPGPRPGDADQIPK